MLKNLMARNVKLTNETGASMTEYIIIVALVAIFLIGAVGLFGDKVKSLFSTSTGKLNQVQSKMNSR